MSNDNTRHAIVVGAGIVGICCGIELKRRGFAVSIIDRLDPGEACSYGNAGILAAQAVVPMAMPGLIARVPRMLIDPDSPLVVRPRALPKTLPWLWQFYKATKPEKVVRSADAMKALYGTTVELHEQLAREAGVPELVVASRYLHVTRDARKADVRRTSPGASDASAAGRSRCSTGRRCARSSPSCRRAIPAASASVLWRAPPIRSA